MALTRIDNPTPSAPAALADYVQILAVANAAQLQALRGNSHSCIDFTNNFAREGVVFYVGGVLYKAATDQAIGGAPSKYVKITPSGATAAIDYVASLAGVSWDDAQSGYYDGSGNLYVFDEARAVYDGVVSAGKTLAGLIAYIPADLSIKGSILNSVILAAGVSENSRIIRRKIIDIGDWNMDVDAAKSVNHGLTLNTIRRVNVLIRNDNATSYRPLEYFDVPDTVPGGAVNTESTQVQMSRHAGGAFDDVDHNATGFNRGWIFIDYEV
jgi:hypothetical protein